MDEAAASTILNLACSTTNQLITQNFKGKKKKGQKKSSLFYQMKDCADQKVSFQKRYKLRNLRDTA